jgi:hypothetical protein
MINTKVVVVVLPVGIGIIEVITPLIIDSQPSICSYGVSLSPFVLLLLLVCDSVHSHRNQNPCKMGLLFSNRSFLHVASQALSHMIVTPIEPIRRRIIELPPRHCQLDINLKPWFGCHHLYCPSFPTEFIFIETRI